MSSGLAVASDNFGAAAASLAAYLDNDLCVAVSQYTKDLIVSSALAVDERHETRFAERCRQRIRISYPAIDSTPYVTLCPDVLTAALRGRGLADSSGVGDRIVFFDDIDDVEKPYLMRGSESPWV